MADIETSTITATFQRRALFSGRDVSEGSAPEARGVPMEHAFDRGSGAGARQQVERSGFRCPDLEPDAVALR